MNKRNLTVWHHLAVLGLVIAAIIFRRPDALFNPQFYSEDGWVWYADAWNLGALHALLLPAGGYLNTLPRLVCAFAIHIPLRSAPLLLNCAGILIQALPVNILLSARCSNWGPLWMRALQAALYVALPNSRELDVTITNAHWHLALAGCLLAFSNDPLSKTWKVADITVLLLAGLTGPWALVLAPLMFAFWWIRRHPWCLRMAVLLAVCAAVQGVELFLHSSERQQAIPLGATAELFSRLVAGQIYAGAVWGQSSFDLRGQFGLILAIFAAGSAFICWGLLSLRLEMKLFILFSFIVLAAALRAPLITGQGTQWQLLAIDKGARYWFFPMLAFLWTLLWATASSQQRALRVAGSVLLICQLRGVVHDWHYFPYKGFNFGSYVRQFELASPGATVNIPVYPNGHLMALIKRM